MQVLANTLEIDNATAIGIGNIAGAGLVTYLTTDGANQLGNLGGHSVNKQRFKDYTGFAAVNPDSSIVDPRYWQPTSSDDTIGAFTYQKHIAPQLALIEG